MDNKKNIELSKYNQDHSDRKDRVSAEESLYKTHQMKKTDNGRV